jgi:hypothetical protein
MPESSLRRQELNQKKPYFIASVCCLILVLFAFGWFYQNVAGEKSLALVQLQEEIGPLKQNETALNTVKRELTKVQNELGQYSNWMEDRLYWGRVLSELRDVFIEVELQVETTFSAQFGQEVKTGVWLEKMLPADDRGPLNFEAIRMEKPGADLRVGIPTEPPPPRPSSGKPGAAPPSGEPDITQIFLFCRGFNLDQILPNVPDANTKMVHAVATALKARTNLVEAAQTQLYGDVKISEDKLTWEVKLAMKLKRPFQF